MRACKQNFPGLDRDISDRLSQEVAIDESAILDSLAQLRKERSASLEAIAYILGNNPGRLSGYLKGSTTTSLTNYLRIARALGYRSRIVFERADLESSDSTSDPLSTLRLHVHKVYKAR
jgi:transcriptional regulator with XRE-family HTH domain